MWNWLFPPTCPVDEHAKDWLETRLLWLQGQFGRSVFTERQMILPTAKFFPDPYDGTYDAVRMMLDRVCDYMEVPPDHVHLELYQSVNPEQFWLVNEGGQMLPQAAGLYERGSDQTVIHLDQRQLANPMDLVGTMAHELAHHRLMGEDRVDGEDFDNELLTDLTAVYHGLGIFLANVPRAWASDFSVWPGTEARRAEYMTLPMYGYALAHVAWLRSEPPDWTRALRPDARVVFRQGLRYLKSTGNSRLKSQCVG